MIATAAESNPTCFSPEPLLDLESTFYPSYIRVIRKPVHHTISHLDTKRLAPGSPYWESLVPNEILYHTV